MNKAVSSGFATHRAAKGKRAVIASFIPGLALFCLTLLPSALRAGDQALTLAMANYSSLITVQLSPIRETPSVSDAFSGEFPTTEYKAIIPERLSIAPASTSFFANPIQSEAVSSLWLTRTDVSRYEVFWKMWSRIEAGYGQIFSDQTAAIYGRYGTGWEEPGYGYLKVSLRF